MALNVDGNGLHLYWFSSLKARKRKVNKGTTRIGRAAGPVIRHVSMLDVKELLDVFFMCAYTWRVMG